MFWNKYIILFFAFLFSASELLAGKKVTELLPEHYKEKARTLMVEEKWSEAQKQVEEGLKLYPDDATLNWLLGRCYFVGKDYKKARFYLLRSINEDDSQYDAKRLMISVEEELGNYSSAIGFCNELLEKYPYEKYYWQRKIDLYRVTKNDVVADKLLTRLYEIFPEDSDVVKSVNYQMELKYIELMRNGKLQEATDNLVKLIENRPDQRQYYIDLINVYKRRGMYDKAMEIASSGITRFGSDQEFVTPKVKILSAQGRYQEALNCIAEQKTGGYLVALKRDVLNEAADAARMNDAYEMAAKKYENTKSSETLTYLLNQSVSRGYYEDAIYYLRESMKKYGRTEKLLSMQYSLEKREGHDRKAASILNEMYERFPNNQDVAGDYMLMLLNNANSDYMMRDWKNASYTFDRILGMNVADDDIKFSCRTKLLSCYGNMGRYEDVANLYKETMNIDDNLSHRQIYTDIFEEETLKKIKQLAEEEAWNDVNKMSIDLLGIVPNSDAALRYAINSSEVLHHDNDYEKYVMIGYNYYPNDSYYIVNRSIVMERKNDVSGAYNMILRSISKRGRNQKLTSALSDLGEKYALQLINENKCDSAMAVLDSALYYNPQSKSLNFTKGIAYEKSKDLLNAYRFQSRYADISLVEYKDFQSHLNGLRYRGAEDVLSSEYSHTIANEQSEYSNAMKTVSSLFSFEYSHKGKKNNSYSYMLYYKGVEGDVEGTYDNGGAGIQGIFQINHKFNDRLSGYANIGGSTKYFSRISANVSGTYYLRNEWEASLRLGFRKTDDVYNYQVDNNNHCVASKDNYLIFIATPSIGKVWNERFNASVSCDVLLMDKDIYYNALAKGKYFFLEDGVSSISAHVGIGSFPELNIFDQAVIRSVAHTNTSVGVNLMWLMTPRFCLGLGGSIYTYYNPIEKAGNIESYYRNLYNINIQMNVAF